MGAAVKRLILVFLLVVLGSPVLPALADPSCAGPTGVYTGPVPWAQMLLTPAKVWSLTNGSGVQVAVLGTGVDPGNGQFAAGQVLPEIDLLGGAPSAPDCDGQGTFAAGIVAAQPSAATSFAGLAPGARILPVRYTATADPQGGADPNLVATAIDRAVQRRIRRHRDHGARRHRQQRAATGRAERDRRRRRRHLASGRHVPERDQLPDRDTGRARRRRRSARPGPRCRPSPAATSRWPPRPPTWSAPRRARAVSSASAGRSPAPRTRRPTWLVRWHCCARREPALDPAQITTRLLLTASHNGGAGHSAQLGWGVVDPDNALTAESARRTRSRPSIGSTVGPRTGSGIDAATNAGRAGAQRTGRRAGSGCCCCSSSVSPPSSPRSTRPCAAPARGARRRPPINPRTFPYMSIHAVDRQ